MRRERPALEGGSPVRNELLTFGRPLLTEEDEREVLECIRSGWLGYGPRSQTFEREFAEFLAAPHAVGLHSCTAALHLALVIGCVSAGDEVITTPITFPSTANVIVHCGARPVFVDVEPDTFNIDPAAVERAVTPHTRAIIAVHMAGRSCDMRALRQIADRHGLLLIEDAAHAIETLYEGKAPGASSDFAAFSFYVTKNLCTVEGGMLVTRDGEAADRARLLRMHGITREAWSRYTSSGFVPYETEEPGYNCAITDYQSALGLRQLARIDERWERRRQIVAAYDAAFAGIPSLQLPARSAAPSRDAYHLAQVLVDEQRLGMTRDAFAAALQAEGIGIGVHFTPLHLHAYYRRLLGMRAGSLPVAESIGRRTLSLPLSAAMTDADVHDVVRAVTKVTGWYAHRPVRRAAEAKRVRPARKAA